MATCTGLCAHSKETQACRLRLRELSNQLKRRGVYSTMRVQSAGFTYTDVADIAQCSECGLELSGWTREKDPFRFHAEKRPNCTFIRSLQSKNRILPKDEDRQMDFTASQQNLQKQGLETAVVKQVRVRTFSHWTNRTGMPKEKLIAAGFFACNVNDRVICLYCNVICQSWQNDIDDPVEVHRTLSPKCAYVLLHSMEEDTSFTANINEISTENALNLVDSSPQPPLNQMSSTPAHHAAYTSITSRYATFQNWTNERSPSVDDLVKAGFFYDSIKNIMTCFHCNGSLEDWTSTASPLIEHIKRFPHCTYARQLSGDSLYNKVQQANRDRQEPGAIAVSTNTHSSQRLQVNDEAMLSRLVAARLDLPVSQRLLDQNFSRSVIRRCWEDQLRLKHDDFVTDCDLFIACLMLQKQIKFINGNRDSIIVPSVRMKAIHAGEHSDTSTAGELPPSTMNSLNNSLTMTNDSAAESDLMDTRNVPTETGQTTSETKVPLNNPCLMCGEQEKRLACIPCGHLATCIDCSKTLRTCLLCRREIEAFVRVYL